MSGLIRGLLVAVPMLSATHAAAATDATPADDASVQTIEVYAASPLGAAGADSQRATANTQSLDAAALDAPALRSIGDAVQKLGSVFRSDATGNPFQPDLFYRGYSISPLLGLAQGLAVYQDGVRVNEPFGDTVNFDLIPVLALAGADLVPGSNPVFGRNALGGALVLHTKTGFDLDDSGVELSAGEFGRYGASAETGFASERFALYAAADRNGERGWRDYSASQVQRGLVRGSWRPDTATQLDLSLNGADNRLRGNGAAPRELLDAQGRDAVFTHPDETRPRLWLLNAQARHDRADGARISGNVYFRRNNLHTFNGDGSEFQACEDPINIDSQGRPYLCEEGEPEQVVADRSGAAVVASSANDSATRNRSRTDQHGYGLAAQWEQPFGAHRVLAGVAVDRGRVKFDSSTELGQLTDTRGTRGSGQIVGESIVDVHARNDSLGLYLMDTWDASEHLQVSLAGRWNRTVVALDDQIPGGDLSGTHRFARLNPMLGYAYTFAPGWTQFASFGQATRAPTPVELTCANPDDPCRLPNGFVDDPPLDEVVTRTLEIGLRYRGRGLASSVALFRAVNRDDILFITDGDLANQGYFDNVGRTLRQGVEASTEWAFAAGWSASAQFTALVAEFRDPFLVSTPNHPRRDPLDPASPDPATRQVRSGDRIPLIPQHQFRLALDWTGARLDVGLAAVGRGNSRFRGDEANLDAARLGGFVLLNAQAAWRLRPGFTLFASVENLLDRDVETFGVYGDASGVLGSAYADARRFVGPGSPRMLVGGLQLRF